MALTPFHIAVPCRDVAEARAFYGELLGCPEGRSDTHWVDFNLFGHQVVAHLDAALGPEGRIDRIVNPVDGESVPVPHYGVILEKNDWQALADRLREQTVEWVIEPTTRFAGQTGEQSTMFFLDPTGNALEFKAFTNISEQLFAK